MQIQNINVIRLQLLQTIPHTDMQTLRMVSTPIRRLPLPLLPTPIIRRKLRREDNMVAIPALGHPLADPGLALLVLVVVRRVDEVAAGVVVGVQEREGVGFGHGPHPAGPGVADRHGAELEGGDAEAALGREDTVAAEFGGGLGGGDEEVGHGEVVGGGGGCGFGGRVAVELG